MYDYVILKNEIEELNPVATEVASIGNTVMGRELYCLKMGRGEKKLVVTGAHHGLEYITSCFLMKFAREYNFALMHGKKFIDRDAVKIFSEVTLYILPMINPDGVDIAVNGLDITNPAHRKLISSVGIHSFRKVWQANSSGVDLNHNYDALWQNTVTKPAPSLYGGKYPESEPETVAVCEFLRKVNADMLICFHSQGKEIYYDFDGTVEKRSESIANRMADASGYTTAKPVGTAAYGGCKDWFIKEFGNPGFTVEMAIGKNPISTDKINELYLENAKIILTGISELTGT
ncbi:MAG: M14 family metallocarboxypeptidase [Clostridia bacterium]|nr:M14 family metallocarboxypeptidase [Clostridia bacterium]